MNAKALKQSFLLHAFFLLAFAIIYFNKNPITINEQEEFKFEVIEEPKKIEAQTIPVINAPKKIETPPPAKPVEAVYGVSRKAITSEGASAVSVKLGNTLAKEVDNKELDIDDPDQLPIPTAEFLVTQMPVVINEVRPDYPKMARDKGIEGKVILDILIDQNGIVRGALIVSDPGYGLAEAALEAIKKFKFRPAKIEKKAVAVKIKYAINFVLEE